MAVHHLGRAGETPLTPKQLAQKLHVTLETLRRWRIMKYGPPYYRVHRYITYYEKDVAEWLETVKERA